MVLWEDSRKSYLLIEEVVSKALQKKIFALANINIKQEIQ